MPTAGATNGAIKAAASAAINRVKLRRRVNTGQRPLQSPERGVFHWHLHYTSAFHSPKRTMVGQAFQPVIL